MGELLSVGDLDIVIHAVQRRRYQGKEFAFIQFSAANTRGREYSLRPSHFRLVSDDRLVHDASTYDSALNSDRIFQGVTLASAGSVDATVAFRMPNGANPVELWFEPFASRNRLTVPLPRVEIGTQ